MKHFLAATGIQDKSQIRSLEFLPLQAFEIKIFQNSEESGNDDFGILGKSRILERFPTYVTNEQYLSQSAEIQSLPMGQCKGDLYGQHCLESACVKAESTSASQKQALVLILKKVCIHIYKRLSNSIPLITEHPRSHSCNELEVIRRSHEGPIATAVCSRTVAI